MPDVQSIIASVKEAFWDEGAMCYHAYINYGDDVERFVDRLEEKLDGYCVKHTIKEYGIIDPVELSETYIIIIAWLNEEDEIEIEQITTY